MTTPLRGRKLGVLISTGPSHRNFRHGILLAAAGLEAGLGVYVYCIDDAVEGLDDPQLQSLKSWGLNLFACGYAAQRRSIPTSDLAVFAGLSIVSDLIAGTDRFVSFN